MPALSVGKGKEEEGGLIELFHKKVKQITKKREGKPLLKVKIKKKRITWVDLLDLWEKKYYNIPAKEK